MARFSEADIAGAVAAFVANTPGREVPAIGKNSSVTVYGENVNPYKPVLIREDEDGPSEKISGPDIGVELPGDD